MTYVCVCLLGAVWRPANMVWIFWCVAGVKHREIEDLSARLRSARAFGDLLFSKSRKNPGVFDFHRTP